ncbi:MAG: ATP-binding protein [Clostridiaceae bacterium]|nr:ATP-binding protein [Clostridiaceae bacterium]
MKKSLTVKAESDNLHEVTAFVEAMLTEKGCPEESHAVIAIILEEIFINIASYAYSKADNSEENTAEIECEISDDGTVQLTFIDNGVQYNPLEKKDPLLTAAAEERQIGGLGIYMVKNMVDRIVYEYKEGKNILKIEKIF